MGWDVAHRRRLLAAWLGVLVLAGLGLWLLGVPTFRRSDWVEDEAQLRAHLSKAYANLDWALEEKRLDVAALHQRTLEALQRSRSNAEAQAALAALLGAFHDGHLQFEGPRPASGWLRALRERLLGRGGTDPGVGPFAASASAEEVCRGLGFVDVPKSSSVDWSLQGAVAEAPVGSSAFPAALLPGTPPIALLRIPDFRETAYPAACRAAWPAFAKQLKGPCDERCQETFASHEVGEALLAELTERLKRWQAEGITHLVVDVTANGGGNDWAGPAARLFSQKTLECPHLGFVRHPHWATALRHDEAEVHKDAERSELLPPADRALLTEAKGRLAALVEEAEKPCRLDEAWTVPGFRPQCHLVVREGLYSCGLYAFLPAGSLKGVASADVLYDGLSWRAAPGVWSGYVAVLVDSGTASASEEFASMLQTGGAAVLVGARTLGAGCGHTNGGIRLELKHSGLVLKAPDCVRYRKDGANEVEGIPPDLAVPWSKGDSPQLRGQKALAILRSWAAASP